MRHYLWYRTDGELGNAETRSKGWPAHADPRDPNTTDPTAQWLRGRRPAAEPDFGGFVAYDCDCDPSVVSCRCPYTMLMTHYFDGQSLIEKPVSSVEVDGRPVTGINTDINDCVPGSPVSCVIRAEVEDGHQLLVSNVDAPFKLLDAPVTVTFTGGVSSPIVVTAPPQGVAGAFQGKSKYVRYFCVIIRGWE